MAQGLAGITYWVPCAPQQGSPSLLHPVSQVQLNWIMEWGEQEEGINETGTLGAASLLRACAGKIASWPFLLNEASNNMSAAQNSVTGARRLSFIRLPPCLFMEMKSGGEVFGQKCCRLLMRGRNTKPLLVCGNVIHFFKASNQAPAVSFLCLGLRTRKQIILAHECYFNSELMITICRIKVHVNVL